MSMKSTTFPVPSRGGRTRQSEKDACDVNLIVAAHKRGGVSAHTVKRVGEFGFAPATDFRESMQRIRETQELFMELPSETRKFFHNDPARFVDYVGDKSHKDKLLELGLAAPKVDPEPVLGSAGNPIHTVSPEAQPSE